MKIGILGGSFDPIHNGHIHMAECAYQELDLDQVWLMPAGHSPNKNEANMTEAAIRLEMCRIAARPYEWLSVNSLETDSGEKSYTYRTMEKLHSLCPKDEFFFIMGADSFDYFDCWVHPEIISMHCTIVVIPRKDYDISQKKLSFPCLVRILHCEMYTISSTELRSQIANGRVEEEYIPRDVLEYIQKKRLYHGFD